MYDYRFLLDAYLGTGGFADGSYLIPYPRETEEKLKRRRELAFYPNFVKKIVDTFVNTVFSTPPARKDLPDEYTAYIQNTDRKNTYIDEFMKNLLRLSLIYGSVFVVIDKENTQARTRAEESLPYAVVLTPDAIENIEADEFGNITSITIKTTYGFLTFTEEDWIKSKDKDLKQVIEQGKHALGKLPVIHVSWRESLLPTEIPVQPFILEIARLNRDLYNAISELREILRATTFPVFTLPVKDLNTLEEIRRQGITVGTENVIIYNPEGGGRPDYIAPSPEPIKVYLEYINMLIELIYKSVNLEFVLGTSQQKSGVALEFEFQDLNRMLSGFASRMEAIEYQIADLVMRWYDKEFDGVINYKKEFSFRDVERELKLAYDALSLNISPTFEIELKKNIVRLLLDEVDDWTLERIDNEIAGLEGLDNQLNRELANES